MVAHRLARCFRFSLRTSFLAISLFCLVSLYCGASSRRQRALEPLVFDRLYTGYPIVDRISVRDFPWTEPHEFVNLKESEIWYQQRPLWIRLTSWPLIEEAGITFSNSPNNLPDYDGWERGWAKALAALDVRTVVLAGDVDDEAISHVLRLPIEGLVIFDQEKLSPASLDLIAANRRLKELDIEPHQFSKAEIEPLMKSRKWKRFHVPID